jgi:hypothetical protein
VDEKGVKSSSAKETVVSYVYAKVDDLDNTELVGSHQCVALVEHYAKAPLTSMWREGKAVKANLSIAKGTAIATFVNGKYPNHGHGNHAALYVSQDAGGIWVIDQWKGDPKKPQVSKRYIRSKGKGKNGTFIDPSNNADAFSLIE